jgi:hypothetical protein
MMTRLLGVDVETDEIDDLLVELKRAHVIDGRTVAKLLGNYFKEKNAERAMGFRFRRSIKLFPGVRINLSKSGTSVSVGKPGATVNIGHGRTTTTVGLPGTGLSYRTSKANSENTDSSAESGSSSTFWLLVIMLACVALFMALGI